MSTRQSGGPSERSQRKVGFIAWAHSQSVPDSWVAEGGEGICGSKDVNKAGRHI